MFYHYSFRCRTTEFSVVIPIEEDAEFSPTSRTPTKSPVRTDTMKTTEESEEKDSAVVVDEMSIPLPGTPTNDCNDGEHCGDASERETVERLALNLDVEHPQDTVIPDSPRSSQSFSSRGSTKSTDVLLPMEKIN